MIARRVFQAASLLALCACVGQESSDPADSVPRATLVSPNGGEFAPTQAVRWLARDDDDDDRLSIDLELTRLDGEQQVVSTEVIASELDNVVGSEAASFAWDRAQVPIVEENNEPIPYLMRVIATDLAGNTASDESDESFTLLDGTSLDNLDWDDISPILVAHCTQCHGEPAASADIEFFRLDKYDQADTEAPANSDLGAKDMILRIQQRLLDQGSMPPFGSEPPSDLDKMRVQRWIDDDAPFSR